MKRTARPPPDVRDPPARTDAVQGATHRATHEIDSECLGSYPDLDTFVHSTLAPRLPPELHWLLSCLDLARVLGVLTANGSDHLRVTDGRVYLDRGTGPSNVDPTGHHLLRRRTR